jgi:hypothetical protein
MKIFISGNNVNADGGAPSNISVQKNTSSSAVEMRGQFKAIERLVHSAVQLRLLHASREDYKSSEDNGLAEGF